MRGDEWRGAAGKEGSGVRLQKKGGKNSLMGGRSGPKKEIQGKQAG